MVGCARDGAWWETYLLIELRDLLLGLVLERHDGV